MVRSARPAARTTKLFRRLPEGRRGGPGHLWILAASQHEECMSQMGEQGAVGRRQANSSWDSRGGVRRAGRGGEGVADGERGGSSQAHVQLLAHAHAPGTTGFRLTKANESLVRANTSEPWMVCGPNLYCGCGWWRCTTGAAARVAGWDCTKIRPVRTTSCRSLLDGPRQASPMFQRPSQTAPGPGRPPALSWWPCKRRLEGASGGPTHALPAQSSSAARCGWFRGKPRAVAWVQRCEVHARRHSCWLSRLLRSWGGRVSPTHTG